MSFSSETKKELCRAKLKPVELAWAEAYGLLLFAKKFSSKEIYFRTESVDAANRFADVITIQTGAIVEISKSLSVRGRESIKYKVSVVSENDCEKVYSQCGHNVTDLNLKINWANIGYDMCMGAFLRGAFLTCGSVSSPETEYRLEFCVQHKVLSDELCRFIEELGETTIGRRITPKVLVRRGAYIVYIKDSEDISDLLTIMGAGGASMTIMQVKILRNAENNRIRVINSQLANTDKTLSAAAKQVQAIEILKSDGRYSSLSDELKEAAEIREKYPLVSLKELCTYFEKPISKSGLNHRLNKLIELAGL